MSKPKFDCKQETLQQIKTDKEKGLLEYDDFIAIQNLKTDIEGRTFEEFLSIKGDEIEKEKEINSYSVFISKKKDNRFVRAILKTDSEKIELVEIVYLTKVDTNYYNSS